MIVKGTMFERQLLEDNCQETIVGNHLKRFICGLHFVKFVSSVSKRSSHNQQFKSNNNSKQTKFHKVR